MDRQAASRRQPRTHRVTLAVVLLAAATLLLLAAIATRDLALVALAGVAGVAVGWVSLRLAWVTVVQSRFAHAIERTALSRAYRALFAERSTEVRGFVETMTARLAERDQLVDDLESSLAEAQTRASLAEAAWVGAEAGLEAAAEHAEALEVRVEELLGEVAELRAAATAQDAPALPPEWALRADPTAAMMAWEVRAEQAHEVDERTARPA